MSKHPSINQTKPNPRIKRRNSGKKITAGNGWIKKINPKINAIPPPIISPIGLMNGFIVEQYDFGADLISEIIDQYDFGVDLASATSENYIDWIKQWIEENPNYFNRKEILFYRGKIPDEEFRKEEICFRMINHPSYIMVENIARNYPDSPLGNL